MAICSVRLRPLHLPLREPHEPDSRALGSVRRREWRSWSPALTLSPLTHANLKNAPGCFGGNCRVVAFDPATHDNNAVWYNGCCKKDPQMERHPIRTTPATIIRIRRRRVAACFAFSSAACLALSSAAFFSLSAGSGLAPGGSVCFVLLGLFWCALKCGCRH